MCPVSLRERHHFLLRSSALSCFRCPHSKKSPILPLNPPHCQSRELHCSHSQIPFVCQYICAYCTGPKWVFSTPKAVSGVRVIWRQQHYMLLYVALPKELSLVLIPHKTLQGRDDLDRLWRFLSTSDPLWECWQRGLAVPVKMSPFSSLWENDSVTGHTPTKWCASYFIPFVLKLSLTEGPQVL